MPGKVLQSLTKVGTRNPLFLLDEIDKLGMDFRGDPSSALLEVLDPEQNHTFSDHYVEVDFDLSDTMFIATSNSMNIPPALLDRMEVIRLSGYTEDEKINIALRYLLPKQQKNNGVKDEEIEITESAMRGIVRYYTREAGVRSLEREISKVCRKVVKAIQLKEVSDKVVVTEDNLNDYLGVRKYDFGQAEKQNQVGQVVGLAWTEVGGDLLTIEAAVMPGKGNIIRTGQLGDVMKESVEAARSVVRSRAARLGIKEEMFEKRDVHIHVPDGATPKDGPSAGAAMTTAFVSALTGIPVRAAGGDDRRDHAARRGHGDRRPEGKAARGPPRRHQDGAHPGRQRQGPPGHPREREEPARDRAGQVDRPGAGARSRAGAPALARRGGREAGRAGGSGSGGSGGPAPGRCADALMPLYLRPSPGRLSGPPGRCGSSSVGRAQPCQG